MSSSADRGARTRFGVLLGVAVLALVTPHVDLTGALLTSTTEVRGTVVVTPAPTPTVATEPEGTAADGPAPTPDPAVTRPTAPEGHAAE